MSDVRKLSQALQRGPPPSAQPDNHLPKPHDGSTLAPAARRPAAPTSDTIRSMRGSSSFARFSRYFSSSVGTKLLIGITGLLLFAYLILHLAGNALILTGA